MTAPTGSDQEPTVKQPYRIRNTTILILGVIIIPFALALALNSYGPVTIDSALRMAASTVAGGTIAILSAITATVLAITRRYSLAKILLTILIAALITSTALSDMTRAGDDLVSRINSITEITTSNQ